MVITAAVVTVVTARLADTAVTAGHGGHGAGRGGCRVCQCGRPSVPARVATGLGVVRCVWCFRCCGAIGIGRAPGPTVRNRVGEWVRERVAPAGGPVPAAGGPAEAPRNIPGRAGGTKKATKRRTFPPRFLCLFEWLDSESRVAVSSWFRPVNRARVAPSLSVRVWWRAGPAPGWSVTWPFRAGYARRTRFGFFVVPARDSC